MFTHFNFWYVIAPLGAIVTALVGYNRSHRYGKHYVRLEWHNVWLNKTLAVFFAILVCVLIFIESHLGMVELFMVRASDDLSFFFGAVAVACAPIMVSALYGVGLFYLARRCARIGAKKVYRCPIHRRLTVNGRERLIIKASDLAKILIEALVDDPKRRRLLKTEIDRQSKLVSFAQHNTKAEETPATKLVEFPAHSASSGKLVEFEFCDASGVWHKITAPANCAATLQASIISYKRALNNAWKVVQLSASEAQVIPGLPEYEHTSLAAQKPTAMEQLQAALEGLSPEDRQLVEEAVAMRPGLFEKVDNDDAYLRIQLVGKGEQRHVRIGGISYSSS